MNYGECVERGVWRVTGSKDMSMERMADLERRISALEERTRRALWNEEGARAGKEAELTARYGEYVDKTVAARVLGVTRATVYAMLADGRIDGAMGGRRVDVRSIARYMTLPRSESRRRSGTKREKPADMTPPAVKEIKREIKNEIKRREGKQNECA